MGTLRTIALAAPSFLVAAWLALILAGYVSLDTQIELAHIPLPVVPLTAMIGLFALSGAMPRSSAALRRWALLVPCIMAPTALLHPWSFVNVGYGIGFIQYFVHWLTKYPDFGPVNYEVLAGIGALGVAAFGPPLFAALFLGRANRWVLTALAVIILTACVAVAVALDRFLVLTVLDESTGEIFIFPGYGPLTRVLAVASVCVLTIYAFRRRDERP